MGDLQTTEPGMANATTNGSGDVGDRIAAILDAAEAAAERIRNEARTEATEILRQAHAQAASRMDELTREPQRLRDEAAHDAERTRQTAEERARVLVADAEQEALRLRTEAEAEVRQIEAAGERRAAELAAQARELGQVRDGAATDVRAAIESLRVAADRLDAKLVEHLGEEGARKQESGWTRLLRREPAPQSSAPALPSPESTPSDDLYVRAKELGIKGRSKMSRDELAQAVREAAGGEPA